MICKRKKKSKKISELVKINFLLACHLPPPPPVKKRHVHKKLALCYSLY